VPLAPVLTDRVLATPPAVPFVVGVEVRLGVRLAAAGDDAETRAGVLRPGVPVAGGLLAVAVAMMCAVCCCCCVDSKEANQSNANQKRSNGTVRISNGGSLAIVAAVELGLVRCLLAVRVPSMCVNVAVNDYGKSNRRALRRDRMTEQTATTRVYKMRNHPVSA
jgi:hypothetical protein